jgi:hypothetical protein
MRKEIGGYWLSTMLGPPAPTYFRSSLLLLPPSATVAGLMHVEAHVKKEEII